MPSLLERERKILACVPLGRDETQMFETDLFDARARGGLRRKIKSVEAERDGSGSAHDVHMVETRSNDSPAKKTLTDNEALIDFSLMLCIQWLHITHSLHVYKLNGKSLTDITRREHGTNRRRGDCPEQTYQ